jgi:RNA polymerase sigma-70 factor (ECF subfamily)
MAETHTAAAEGEVFRELRPLLFSVAYRMLGSVAEAEDVVQEAFLRAHRATREGTRVDSPKAYLTAVTTRLAIDQLRSARVRRESYVGQWLPEPLVEDAAPDPTESDDMADSLSMAFLVLLETLSPVERAVFVLREVFGYGYDKIAEIVGKSEVNTRQIATRARRRIEEGRPRFETSSEQRQRLAERFFAAARDGDLGRLEELLATDASFHGDGGGKASAYPRPIDGRDQVGRLVLGLFRRGAALNATLRPVWVNGQPGALTLDPDGRLINVLALDIRDGAVHTIRSVINPDKLEHLGPLADLASLGLDARGRAADDQ